MKKGLFVLAFGFAAVLVVAKAHAVQTLSLGFIAPWVGSTSDVVSPEKGEIVYDTSTDTFKGRNNSTWVDLDGSGGSNVTANSASNFHVESATITNNGSTCVSSPSAGAGTWIASLTRNGGANTSDCTINFNTGQFSAAPVCVAMRNDGGAGMGAQTSVSSSAIRIVMNCSNGTACADLNYNLICMGTR
jgi:hypothetical protein